MKYIPIVAGALLGLMFVPFCVMFFLGLMPNPEIPKDTPLGMFMGAFGPTGYITFVKAMELLGGILVAIPKLRNFGLLILGPILVNILAFHIFITGGQGLTNPVLIAIVVLELYLLWVGRKEFLGLLN